MQFYSAENSLRIITEWNSKFPRKQDDLKIDVTAALDRSFALSRLISSTLDPNQTCFLWIREFGVWLSLENIDLFDHVRSASGCTDRLESTPGQSFEPGEGGLLVCYIQLMLLNCWGGVIVGHGNGHRVAFSHDSWISLRTSLDIGLDAARFTEFGLPSREDAPPEHLVLL